MRGALNGGANQLIVSFFENCADWRKHVRLSADEYQRLGKILTGNKHFDSAVWCYRAMEAVGGEKLAAQKGIIAVADAAAAAGDNQKAVAFYNYIVKNYPASPLVQYCGDALSRLS